MSVIIKKNKPLYETNFNTWKQSLHSMIKNEILKIIISDATLIDTLINNDNMDNIWIPVFTQEGYPDSLSYESFEKIGDNVMETIFATKLKSFKPNITPDQLNDMINTYLSTTYQSNFVMSKKWNTYIRTKFITDNKTAEDLLEAIFGGLYLVGEKIQIGLGNILANGLMNVFMEGVDYNMDVMRIKSPKTLIIEIFEDYLLLKQPYLNMNNNNKTKLWNIKLIMDEHSTEHINSIIKYFNEQDNQNRKMLDKVIGTYNGKNKKEGELEVYKQAVNLLYSIGFTIDWLSIYKINIKSQTDPLLKLALDKARENGFISIEFSLKVIKNNMVYKYMNGVKEDGSKQFLEDIVVSMGYNKIIDTLLLSKYLGYKEESIIYEYM